MEWTSNNRKTFHAILLTVFALIAALPVTIGLVEFFTSQRPKWRRFKYGFSNLLWGEVYPIWQSAEKLKPNGNPAYCNPFHNAETFCDHRYKISLLLPEESAGKTVFGNEMHAYSLRPDRTLIGSKPSFNVFVEEPTSDFEVDVDVLHITIKIRRQGPVCRLSLTDRVINHTEDSADVNFSMENVRYFFALIADALVLDRTCCFVLDENSFVRKGNKVTAHCRSLQDIFNKVFSGYRAYSYGISTEEHGDMCICIGLH